MGFLPGEPMSKRMRNVPQPSQGLPADRDRGLGYLCIQHIVTPTELYSAHVSSFSVDQIEISEVDYTDRNITTILSSRVSCVVAGSK